ncbi:hypothetical protein LFYK43_23160 [Ligilactobacillus salitolerans]|uniref:N-acetyltransferase domain-containing protein n=1 Tax=Ligilactobacillus salitolerans TaxID=1808352 RepID=A0A401IWH8_9LACO|nr:hypothetical protein LFYK43_23160 [Ligilactobacillus salitolerans]
MIGTITVVHQEPAAACAEIGYCLGQRWWSHGYATEALVSVINFLFSQASFKRIEAKHDTKNPASGKVMHKAGLQYEGTLRQHGLNNTGICDEAIYAILRSDWVAANNL